MRAITALSLMASLVTLTGCSGLHLYNEKADAIAKGAVADLGAAKIGERLKAQRAVLEALEERDVEAFRKLTLAQRDQEILALIARYEAKSHDGVPVVRTTQQGFAARALEKINDRLTYLDGTPETRAGSQLSKFEYDTKLSLAQQEQKVAREQLKSFPGLESLPPCGEAVIKLKGDSTGDVIKTFVNPELKPMLKVIWKQIQPPANSLGRACEVELALKQQYPNIDPEAKYALSNAVNELESQQKESDNSSKIAAEAKNAMNKAAAELGNVTKDVKVAESMKDFTCPKKNGPSPEAAAAAEIDTAAMAPATNTEKETKAQSNLCKSIAQLDSMGSLGKKILSEQKIEKIGHILQALSGVTPDTDEGENVEKSLALVAATTRLHHSLRLYQQVKKLPALEPLIIEKQLAEAQLASANALVKLDQKRLAYRKEIVSAIRQEIYVLGIARSNLLEPVYGGKLLLETNVKCSASTSVTCASYEEMLRSNVPKTGEPLERPGYRAMALYAESYAARDRQMSAQIRLELASYQQSLILSEEAIASWSAVFDTPVDILRQYHAGGIKPADIAAFIQAAGIWTVAARVQ